MKITWKEAIEAVRKERNVAKERKHHRDERLNQEQLRLMKEILTSQEVKP